MMPETFAGANIVMGDGQPEYAPLPAFRSPRSGTVVTCWRVSWREMWRLLWSRRVWLSVWTGGAPLQPVMLEIPESNVLRGKIIPTCPLGIVFGNRGLVVITSAGVLVDTGNALENGDLFVKKEDLT